MKTDITVASLSLLLNKADYELARANISGFTSQVSLRNGNVSVKGTDGYRIYIKNFFFFFKFIFRFIIINILGFNFTYRYIHIFLVMVSYNIFAIVCINLPCVYLCMYLFMFVCMYDVRHDIQIPCTRYVAINLLYHKHSYSITYEIFNFGTIESCVAPISAIGTHS